MICTVGRHLKGARMQMLPVAGMTRVQGLMHVDDSSRSTDEINSSIGGESTPHTWKARQHNPNQEQ
jgi:hypothetical protein